MWAAFFLAWTLLLGAFLFIGLSVIRLVAERLRNADYFIAPIFGLIFYGAFAWLIGWVNFIPLTHWTYLVVLLASLLAAWWILYKLKREQINWYSFFLSLEILTLFMMVFLFFKGFYPSVIDGEKPMEMMMLGSLMRAEHLPPQDAWFFGKPINYYYFGYFIFGSLAKTIGADSFLAFNFGSATVWTLSLIGIGYLAYVLTKSKTAVILAILLYGFLGNLDTLFQITEPSYQTFDWWRTSRAIKGTITEFPAFSYLFGDFHPHMIVSIWLIALIAFLIRIWPLKPTLFQAVLTGLILAQIFLVSSWSALTAGLIIIGYLICKRPPYSLVLIGMFTALLLVLPYQWHLQSTWIGLELVKPQDRSPIDKWLIHWGILLFGVIALIRNSLKKTSKKPMIFILLIVAAVLIFTGEIVFVKDLLGSRYNTVFKLYWDAWLIMALLAALGYNWLFHKGWTAKAVVVAALLAGAPYLILGMPQRYNSFERWWGVDPKVLVFSSAPQLKSAYNIIKDDPKITAVFEKSGDSFTQSNWLSAFTGVPTYLGWFNHEFTWRGHNAYGEISRRRKISENISDCQSAKETVRDLGFDYCFDMNTGSFYDYKE